MSADEMIKFVVRHKATPHDVEFGAGSTVAEVKQHLHSVTGVPVSNQKLIHSSQQLRDDSTLMSCGVRAGAKLLLLGATEEQVAAVSRAPDPAEVAGASGNDAPAKREPLSKQKAHEHVVKSGPPDDAMVGIRNAADALPPAPLTGMRNKLNQHVRLTFKLEEDQIWVATSERTNKIPMGSITSVQSEAIVGHEQYHIVGLHVGTTDASIIWLYWVPAQYVAAIRRMIIG